jgi:hypothetical protein
MDEKRVCKMIINKRLKRENRVRDKEVWETKNAFFVSAGFTSVKKT